MLILNVFKYHLIVQRDTVNFGIYSCNWINMDLQFKKVLLLAMRLNDANQVVIKSTPRKIVNLQLFASVMLNLLFHK